MKVFFIFLSTSLLVLAKPFQKEHLEKQFLVNYLKNHPKIYNDLINLMSQHTELNKFINSEHIKSNQIDFDNLFKSQDLEKEIIQFFKENVHRISKRQIDFNNFLGSFMNVLNTFGQNIQISLQNSVQQLINNTINDIFNRIQSSIFAGQPADLSDIMSNFINNLKRILTNNILQSVNDTFKQQALSTLDLQFNELNKLVDKLKQDSVAPIEFINLLHNSLDNLQKNLAEFLPNISDLLMSQLIKLLDQLLIK